MPPLPSLLAPYIIRTDIKVNKSNLKTFCKPCIKELGEEEEQKTWFPNKKDRIVQHFKKYSTSSQVSLASSSSHKVAVINRSSCYGPMDNYIVRSLSKEDLKKFNMLLLRLTVSCGWALSWVNNPEAKELFDFLNPFLKLPDRRVLGGDILKQVVADADKAMETALKENPVGVTLTFDGWTNVKNEQLLETVILSSEGKPYVWKAVDITSERENNAAVINKTEAMLTELKNKEITVCAIVTDSASAYATARYCIFLLFDLIYLNI
ncbi:unnamed protein product [Rhizophagus irregularis]|nr:unnamed protein product [Rhizophagus irregularis]